MNVAPGSTREIPIEIGTTGLVGTLAIKLDDGTGTTVIGPTTAGITELQTSGSYVAVVTFPTTQGDYVLLASTDGTFNANTVASEPITVTYTSVANTTGSLYATRDELKVALNLETQNYADDDIDRAVAAASRAIDNRCGRIFYTDTATRYYTPDCRDTALDILDVQAITEFALDVTGTGTYTQTLTEGTDYDLEPYNAPITGRPYELARLRPQAWRSWPNYPKSVRVEGTFGWATVPNPVNQYALILASKLLDRARKSPNGVIVYGIDTPIATRISRLDPDFELLLGDYAKATVGV